MYYLPNQKVLAFWWHIQMCFIFPLPFGPSGVGLTWFHIKDEPKLGFFFSIPLTAIIRTTFHQFWSIFSFFFWSNAVMNICTCILLQLNLFSKDLSQVELLKQIVLSICFQGINSQTMLYEQIYYSVWTCNQGLWITVGESGCPKPHSVALFWAFHLQSLELPHTLPPAPI